MKATSTSCGSCGAAVDPADAAAGGGYVTCRFCGATVRVEAPPPPAPGTGPRPPMERPRGVRVEDTGVGFRIVRRWWSPVFIVLLIFCVAWDGFLLFWYTTISRGAPLLFALFPIIHVAVGVGLTYFTLAGLLNSTIIEVARSMLTVRHAPLPWRGVHEIPASDLAQIFCEERVSKSENGTSITYRVSAVRKDGSRLKLLSGLSNRDQAIYIEQQMERHLGITDRPVAGEVARD